MKAVVLGTGMIGTTVVRELAKLSTIDQITAVDGFQASIDRVLAITNSEKVDGKVASLNNEDDILKVLEGADVAVACLPHSLSMSAIRAAIAAKCHLVDLVGSRYPEKAELDSLAKEANVTIVPGCGVAPGITNFLAARGIELLDQADEAVMVCGGIPRHPLPPLFYQVVFRLESVMGLYTRPALAVENGEQIELPPLSGLEVMEFPEPVGKCEAVITDAHSVAYTLKDKVNHLYEKTVRYAGHWDKMATLAELGFLDEEEIEFNGQKMSPRQFTTAILEPQLKGKSNEDITVLRVTVTGKKSGKSTTYEWEMVDLYDHDRGITSMAKTTAFPAVNVAHLIANGTITERGVLPVEQLIIGERFDPFIEALDAQGVHITFRETTEE
jgi:lysine 6-dehydrogenase